MPLFLKILAIYPASRGSTIFPTYLGTDRKASARRVLDIQRTPRFPPG